MPSRIRSLVYCVWNLGLTATVGRAGRSGSEELFGRLIKDMMTISAVALQATQTMIDVAGYSDLKLCCHPDSRGDTPNHRQTMRSHNGSAITGACPCGRWCALVL